MIFQEFKSCFKNHSSKHFPRFLILLFTFVSYVFHLLLHFIFLYFWKRLTGFRYNKKFHVTNQKKKKTKHIRSTLHRRNYIQSQEGRLIRPRERIYEATMGRFLSLSLSLISGCTVIEHRSSLIMLSTKIDSIRTQTSPPSVSPL